MQTYLAFITAHWELGLAFVIILSLLLILEFRAKLSGVAQLSPNETILLINRDQAVIVDIRDNAQFSKGHILGAVNIPATDLEQKIKLLEAHKQKTIILVQTTGQSPAKTVLVLKSNGYLTIKNLMGGMNAWVNANLPLMKD